MVFSSVSVVLRPYTIQPSMLVTFCEAFCPNQDRYELWAKDTCVSLKDQPSFSRPCVPCHESIPPNFIKNWRIWGSNEVHDGRTCRGHLEVTRTTHRPNTEFRVLLLLPKHAHKNIELRSVFAMKANFHWRRQISLSGDWAAAKD